MTQTAEPRVGRDRAYPEVLRDGLDFLDQLRREGVIVSEDQLCSRKDVIRKELGHDTVETNGLEHCKALSGTDSCSGWKQSAEELLWGLRLAWKHSGKCIMRSEYTSLRLRDLRHVTTSLEMGRELIQGLTEAFNNGNIQPTAFVFPHRETGTTGPLIWNRNILAFAGYLEADGTILGDPANVTLTSDMIELGWTPPRFRTRWDLLPLVTMAEGDEPVITEIPPSLFPLVNIRHPKYSLAFEKLGLKWVPAPVLSRLGFDIGGVQYTAAPFIGWFMDAEIGVRNLADTQRYNCLPDLVVKLGWASSTDGLENLPGFERLALLSKAQAELNYAVYWSFSQANVAMSDTLSASAQYCRFDDDHRRENGFRLPANPYWIAPPQGSLVPLWHRGGAPNYQPKPMVCRNVQDPVKLWRRRLAAPKDLAVVSSMVLPPECEKALRQLPKELEKVRNIRICFCTSGVTAIKLANRVHSHISKQYLQDFPSWQVHGVASLDTVRLKSLTEQDVLLIVCSTTGHGEIPRNGQNFVSSLRGQRDLPHFKYSVFGSGSSMFPQTFNWGARTLNELIQEAGGQPLAGNMTPGDTSRDGELWDKLELWRNFLDKDLRGKCCLTVPDSQLFCDVTQPRRRIKHWLRNSIRATLGDCDKSGGNIYKVAINVGAVAFTGAGYINIFTPNPHENVQSALNVLRTDGQERLQIPGKPTCEEFLTEFVDFSQPLDGLLWTLPLAITESMLEILTAKPLSETLKLLGELVEHVTLKTLFAFMPLKSPTSFSIASTLPTTETGDNIIELLVQHHIGGRFSDRFLGTARKGARLRCRITESTRQSDMLKDIDRPLIAFTTGSGLAPVRHLLQKRVAMHREEHCETSPVSLICGFRKEDCEIVRESVKDAVESGVIDLLSMTPSNPSRARAQDKLFQENVKDICLSKILRDEANVFVCANPAAAKDFAENLSALLGRHPQQALGDRYVEDVFHST
ncbi:Nitric oxide synthase-like protein [Venturia nashicola]|nr:Nitric oxide synthase-like protein [Venturia nashicola]